MLSQMPPLSGLRCDILRGMLNTSVLAYAALALLFIIVIMAIYVLVYLARLRRELPQQLDEQIDYIVYSSDFPTEIETLLLRVAANQAAIGLQEARDITEHKRAEEELEQRVAERTSQLTAVKDELAEELRAMTRLHQLSPRLPADTDLQPLLEEILDATMDLLRADFGNVQLYNPETGALEIVSSRGFRQDFLDYFASVRDEGAACGRGVSRGERIIIEDVLTDPAFEPHRAIAASAARSSSSACWKVEIPPDNTTGVWNPASRTACRTSAKQRSSASCIIRVP